MRFYFYGKQFTDAVTTATQCNPKWNNRTKAAFHAFNDNGIIARRTASDDRIRALVDSGFAKSGALLAHGSLNDYHVRKLYNCALKSRVSSFDISYYVERIEHEISAADAFIDSIAACI
jgi:hypothetical protein